MQQGGLNYAGGMEKRANVCCCGEARDRLDAKLNAFEEMMRLYSCSYYSPAKRLWGVGDAGLIRI